MAYPAYVHNDTQIVGLFEWIQNNYRISLSNQPHLNYIHQDGTLDHQKDSIFSSSCSHILHRSED